MSQAARVEAFLALDEKARPLIAKMRAAAEKVAIETEALYALAEKYGEPRRVSARSHPAAALDDIALAVCVAVTAARDAAGASRDTTESFLFSVRTNDFVGGPPMINAAAAWADKKEAA